jgi:hypothetical protein
MDDDGALMLKNDRGVIHRMISGDVSFLYKTRLFPLPFSLKWANKIAGCGVG